MAWRTLMSDIEFLAQYPIVGQAISDTASTTPGYLYGEINSLTYVDKGTITKPLITFLVSQLNADTPQVSLKVLKLLLYLLRNGHQEVVEEIKLQEIGLKKAMGFHGPPDEFHGSSFYENIRKLSREILEMAFDENQTSERLPNLEPSEMTGYGTSAVTNKLTGFGHTVKTPKTVSEKMSDSITNFVEKLLPSGESKPETQTSLSEALPQYKPIAINRSDAPEVGYTDSPAQSTSTPISHLNMPKRKTKTRKAGKPGGGWNDSDDEPENESDTTTCVDPSKTSTISNDSLENSLKFDFQSDWVDERQVVDDFTVNEPLEKLQHDQILALCKRCSSYNCDKVLMFIIGKLSENEEYVKLRALIFIEYLIYHDIVTLDSLVKIVLPALKKETEQIPSPVQMKSKKVCLMIQNLNMFQKENTLTSRLLNLKCGS